MKKFAGIMVILICAGLILGCGNENKNKAYYFQQANFYLSKQQYKKASEYYEKVLQDSAGIAFRARSMFMLGYLYANELKNEPGALEKAKKYYEMFLKEFPDHELAQSVKIELENLGKDPNEIILQFIEKKVEENIEN